MVSIKISIYDGVTIEDAEYIVYELWGELEMRSNKLTKFLEVL